MAERIYDPQQIEAKWQRWWEENKTNETDVQGAKNPYYVLMMFPYPSAEGLHVGNVYAFTGRTSTAGFAVCRDTMCSSPLASTRSAFTAKTLQ